MVDCFITGVSTCRELDRIYCLCLSGEVRHIPKDLSTGFVEGFEGHRRKVVRVLAHPLEAGSGIAVDNYGKVLKFNVEGTRMQRYMRTWLSYNRTLNDGCLSSSGKVFYALSADLTVAAFHLHQGCLAN